MEPPAWAAACTRAEMDANQYGETRADEEERVQGVESAMEWEVTRANIGSSAIFETAEMRILFWCECRDYSLWIIGIYYDTSVVKTEL